MTEYTTPGLQRMRDRFIRGIEEVEMAAAIDKITGLPNRRSLDEELDRQVAAAERHRQSLVVVMLDLDNFKAVDDIDHLEGDCVLREVAQQLYKGIRANDFLGRFGGDEFSWLLPQTSLGQAKKAIARLNAKVFALTEKKSIGISWGLTVVRKNIGVETIIRQADQALKAVKDSGKKGRLGIWNEKSKITITSLEQ